MIHSMPVTPPKGRNPWEPNVTLHTGEVEWESFMKMSKEIEIIITLFIVLTALHSVSVGYYKSE